MVRKSTIAIFILVLACASAQAQVQPAAQPQAPTIKVSGEATMTVEADMAVLSLGIVQLAKTPLAVRAAATGTADKVISSLIALGIEKKQIRTSNFNIYPVYDERPNKQNVIVGYRADTTITLTLEDTAVVAQAVETAVGAGANEIRGLNYKKRDEDSLRVETLKQAVVNATAKAAAMAETLGRKLGKAILAEEQGYSMRAPDSRQFLAKSMAPAAQEAFSPGSIEVSASVSVSFEME